MEMRFCAQPSNKPSDVAVGAHFSYPDRENFGRLSMKGEYDATHLTEVRHRSVRWRQPVRLQEPRSPRQSTRSALPRCRQRRCHRRILHRCSHESFHRNRAGLAVTGAAGSRRQDAAEASSIRFVAEAFVDRAYNTDGTLVPRSMAGAVHDDLPAAVSQASASRSTNRSTRSMAPPSTWLPYCVCTQTPRGCSDGACSSYRTHRPRGQHCAHR